MKLTLENVCNTSFARRCKGHCEANGACICPPGFESTRLIFRLDDCAEPTGLYEAALSIALITGIATLILGLVKIRGAKSEVRRIIQCFMIASFGSCGANVAGLVQGYTDIAFYLGWAVFFLFISIGFSRFIYLFFSLSYATIGKKVRRRGVVKTLLVLNGVCLAAGFTVFPAVVIALGDAYSPTYDVVLYNTVIVWIAATLPVQLFFAIPLGLVVTNDLLRVLYAVLTHHEASGQPMNLPNVRLMKTVVFRLRLFRFIDALVLPVVEICGATLGFGVAYYYRLPTLSYLAFVILSTFNLATGGQILIITYTLNPASTPPPGNEGEQEGLGVTSREAVGGGGRDGAVVTGVGIPSPEV